MNIKRVVWGALGYMYEYRVSLLKALLVPITILVAFEHIPIPEDAPNAIHLIAILPIFGYILLAIITHRIVLLGPGSVPKWGLYIPTKRELYFLLYSVGLILCMIPFMLFLFIHTIGAIIAPIASIYIMSRLSLVLPAIVTEQRWSFSDSWKATKNHQALMVIVVAILPLVLTLPEILLNQIPYIDFLASIVSAFTMVFTIAALSVAFRVITEDVSEG